MSWGSTTACGPGRSLPSPPAAIPGRSGFTVLCRIDTPVEIDYYRNGGILNAVLRRMAG